MTRWAAEVSPTNALPDYPRPQLVRHGLAELKRTLGLRHHAGFNGKAGRRSLEKF